MKYKLYKDNKLLKTFDNRFKLQEYIHNIQAFSEDYALKYGGFKINPILLKKDCRD
tara:strand:+ start:825 stop:992 length:168 start_codon:yes stop_codon:yes gene_type:complete